MQSLDNKGMGRGPFPRWQGTGLLVWALFVSASLSGLSGQAQRRWPTAGPEQILTSAEAVDAAWVAGLPEAPEPRSAPVYAPTGAPGADGGNLRDAELKLKATPRRLLDDEIHIVESPVHIGRRDLRWLIPVAAATAVSLATDTHTMQSVVSHDPGFNHANDTTSGALRDVAIAAPIALFGVGEWKGNSHASEAGLLAGEAMINAIVTDEGIKYIMLRERPQIADQRGHFFAGDAASDPSFVSGHTIVAWSSAAVLAAEYPKAWQQASVYTLASSVSLTRILAQQHFPTDVLLGAVSGWLIGHYVYSAHHRFPSAQSAQAAAAKRLTRRPVAGSMQFSSIEEYERSRDSGLALP